jgi:formylglycine-generating enzyme required for sulfatase activity
MRGDYVEDNGCHTVPIASYSANNYGLYNMAGNVAEWTNTAFDPSVYEFTHDMSSEYDYRATAEDPPAMKRKVIRGVVGVGVGVSVLVDVTDGVLVGVGVIVGNGVLSTYVLP